MMTNPAPQVPPDDGVWGHLRLQRGAVLQGEAQAGAAVPSPAVPAGRAGEETHVPATRGRLLGSVPSLFESGQSDSVICLHCAYTVVITIATSFKAQMAVMSYSYQCLGRGRLLPSLV